MLFRKNIRKFNRKKLILVVVLLLLAIISTINFDYYVSADNDVSQEELSKSVFEILDDVDLNEMQNMVDNLDDIGLFEITIKDKISKILRGEYFTDYTSLTSAIISLRFGDQYFHLSLRLLQ